MVFVSGGPCAGKTKLVEELERRGYPVFHEAARKLSETDEKFKGKSINQIDRRLFQDEIFEFQKRLFNGLNSNGNLNGEFVFSDRGFGDTLAYYRLNGFSIPQGYVDYARTFSRCPVFVLELLSDYKTDELRQESPEERMRVHKEIIKSYVGLRNPMITVPEMPIPKRADFIIDFLGKTSQSKSL